MQVSLEHCASQTEAHIVFCANGSNENAILHWISAPAKCRLQKVAVEDVAAQTEVMGSVILLGNVRQSISHES